MKKLFGTDGVRGIANETLTASLALSLGECFATTCREDTVLVGTDTRSSSIPLSIATCTGISSAGRRAILLGVLPTGALAYLCKRHGMPGVMISASHNPAHYNGIKFFDSLGEKLSDEKESELEEIFFRGGVGAKGCGFGKIEGDAELLTEYLLFLKERFAAPPLPFSAVIDCANGAASLTARALFQNRFRKCTFLCDTPNGENINDACGSTHPDRVARAVRELRADIGLTFDGDADRLIAVDGAGRLIDGDRMLGFFAARMQKDERLLENTVVGTVMSGFGLCRFLADRGISFIAERVGDRYVRARMAEGGYSLGGESSGHLLFGGDFPFGDGAHTALMLLSEMQRSGADPSDLFALYKSYPQCTKNLAVPRSIKDTLLGDSRVQSAISDFEHKIREDGRLLVRPSGTEDVIRITVEAAEDNLARGLCEDVAGAIRKRIDELSHTDSDGA